MEPTQKRNRRFNASNRNNQTAPAASLFSKLISCRALNSFGVLITLVCVLALLSVAFVALPSVHASNPTSGTLTTTSSALNWQGTAVAGGATGDLVGGLISSEDMCIEGVTCDTFTLTIAGTPADWVAANKLVHVHLGWTVPAQDYDLYIHKGDLNGPVVADSGNGATNGILQKEDADLNPARANIGTGTFAVHVVYWTATSADQYQATASVELVPAPPSPTPTPTPSTATEPVGTPRFYSYLTPPGVADFAGEPSIGVNWKSEQVNGGIPNGGTVNYFGGFLSYMLRASFNDTTFPAKINWEKAPLTVATAPRAYGDPILFTDSRTGRTFVSQELGQTPGGSTAEFTDDDGRTFTPSEGSGAPSGIDHQTIGGGPYHAPLPTGVNPLYPNGVWYCSQSIADAVCSLSLDGGRTFGPAVPMYSLADCGGLHGHIKIGADGTAYVPNRACHGDPTSLVHVGGKPALLVSEDNGITWQIRTLEQATTKPDRDPSVAVGSDGTVYFAYQAGDGHSRVAVSHDKGVTWVNDQDLGSQLGINNSLFHAAVSGDGDRAAVAFFGTTTAGGDYDQPGFEAVWYLYISTTFDGGKTWWTQNATPNDPVQRGPVCGSANGFCRNLLDFFGADIDKEGRVLVGYEDGCVSHACITGLRSYGLPASNDYTAKAVIARQTGGKRMFASYDPAGPVAEPPTKPLPPPASLSCDGNVITDSTGDVYNTVLPAVGGADQLDISKVSFALSPDKQSISATITVKDFSTTPPAGTLGANYRVIWTQAKKNADGTITTKGFATEVGTDVTGTVAYSYGEYDQAGNSFVGSSTTATGTTTTGPNGTLTVNVPVSALGNPTIPVTDLLDLPAVIEPYALVFSSEIAVYFVTPVERAPDYGFAGANWAVCNTPPTVSITSPANGATFNSPANITINATAADSDGTISKVEFFQGDTKLGEDTTAPYSFQWNGVGVGSYSLTAKATDNGHASTVSAPVGITVNAAPVTNCLEDDNSAIAYSEGWHTLNSAAASAGHFRYHNGKSSTHSASLTFTVPAGKKGKLTYYYATSTKGGSASVVLDGVAKTVSYKGNSGSQNNPVFGSKLEFANLAAGQHKLEIKNMTDAVYVDGFCLENALPSGPPPTTSPGNTDSGDQEVRGGGESSHNQPVDNGTTAISVAAVSANDLPIKLVLISPSGSVLQIADSVNGVAVISAPVTQSGTYIVKTINLSLGPVRVWTAATPTVRR
ncbi:MAG TPA: hypothetical protein DC047_20375 [Blastocatellia bacterium]|nr:hypothetical protein [Blastocatellia bacterium]